MKIGQVWKIVAAWWSVFLYCVKVEVKLLFGYWFFPAVLVFILFISVVGAENGWWCFWCVCDKCGIWCRFYDRLIVVWSRLLLTWFLVNPFVCVFCKKSNNWPLFNRFLTYSHLSSKNVETGGSRRTLTTLLRKQRDTVLPTPILNNESTLSRDQCNKVVVQNIVYQCVLTSDKRWKTVFNDCICGRCIMIRCVFWAVL